MRTGTQAINMLGPCTRLVEIFAPPLNVLVKSFATSGGTFRTWPGSSTDRYDRRLILPKLQLAWFRGRVGAGFSAPPLSPLCWRRRALLAPARFVGAGFFFLVAAPLSLVAARRRRQRFGVPNGLGTPTTLYLPESAHQDAGPVFWDCF